MPEKGLLLFRLPFQPTLIIYSADCSEEIKNKAKSYNPVLGAVSILDLSQNLLVKQWNALFESRNLRNGKKLSDIDKQYLLDDEKQLFL